MMETASEAAFEQAKKSAEEHLMSPMQAAKYLGITRQRVYQLIWQKELISGHAFERALILRSSVEERKKRLENRRGSSL